MALPKELQKNNSVTFDNDRKQETIEVVKKKKMKKERLIKKKKIKTDHLEKIWIKVNVGCIK